MFTDLQAWVARIGEQFGIAARLTMRRQPEKTPMMEIYELPFTDLSRVEHMLADIEAQAVNQEWFGRIASPRRAELFAEPKPESSD